MGGLFPLQKQRQPKQIPTLQRQKILRGQQLHNGGQTSTKTSRCYSASALVLVVVCGLITWMRSTTSLNGNLESILTDTFSSVIDMSQTSQNPSASTHQPMNEDTDGNANKTLRHKSKKEKSLRRQNVSQKQPESIGATAEFEDGETIDSTNPLLAYSSNAEQIGKPIQLYLEKQLSMSDNHKIREAMQYQKENCIVQEGTKWCPSSVSSWIRRAPSFMIIGAKKSGTTSLWSSLVQHPNIVKAKVKELLFFPQYRFNYTKYSKVLADHNTTSYSETVVNQGRRDDLQTSESDTMVRASPSAGTSKRKLLPRLFGNASSYMIDVAATRQDLLKLFPRKHLKAHHDVISLDAIPENLFNFPTTAKSILCTCPWIKLVIILRHPTDRAWSNYNYYKQSVKKLFRKTIQDSFEDWMMTDLKNMARYGLLTLNTTFITRNEVMTEEEMRQAWFDQKSPWQEGPAARGFYALQIYQWFQELRRIGRDPNDSVRIVRLEDMKKGGPQASRTLKELIDWLLEGASSLDTTMNGITNTTKIDYLQAFKHGMKTDYKKLGSPKMSQVTKDILDRLYAPHNQILSQLLGDERWKYHRDEQDEHPLVWPANQDQTSDRIFAAATMSEAAIGKGPCPS